MTVLSGEESVEFDVVALLPRMKKSDNGRGFTKSLDRCFIREEDLTLVPTSTDNGVGFDPERILEPVGLPEGVVWIAISRNLTVSTDTPDSR